MRGARERWKETENMSSCSRLNGEPHLGVRLPRSSFTAVLPTDANREHCAPVVLRIEATLQPPMPKTGPQYTATTIAFGSLHPTLLPLAQPPELVSNLPRQSCEGMVQLSLCIPYPSGRNDLKPLGGRTPRGFVILGLLGHAVPPPGFANEPAFLAEPKHRVSDQLWVQV